MDLPSYQLRTFLVVARRLSFTRAGEELFLTQPTVTAHICKLQRALGLPLFEQVGRRIELTPAGRLLCRHAERVLALESELRSGLAELSDVCQGPLVLGATITLGFGLLPALLHRFSARHPGVRLRLCTERASEEIVHKVLEGQIDLGLVTWKPFDERLESQPLMEDELILVVPPQHPWARTGTIEPYELASEPFILREPGSITRAVVEAALGKAGVILNAIAAEMSENESVARGVKLGIGVAIVSKLAVATDLETGSLRQVSITGMSMRRPLGLVMRRGRGRTPAMSAFQELLARTDWSTVLSATAQPEPTRGRLESPGGRPGVQRGPRDASALLPEEAWEAVRPLVPSGRIDRARGRPRLPDREALAGILYVLRNGVAWEKLPGDQGCGSGRSCQRRLQEWQQAGAWPRIQQVLRERLKDADGIDWLRASLEAAHPNTA